MLNSVSVYMPIYAGKDIEKDPRGFTLNCQQWFPLGSGVRGKMCCG